MLVLHVLHLLLLLLLLLLQLEGSLVSWLLLQLRCRHRSCLRAVDRRRHIVVGVHAVLLGLQIDEVGAAIAWLGLCLRLLSVHLLVPSGLQCARLLRHACSKFVIQN